MTKLYDEYPEIREYKHGDQKENWDRQLSGPGPNQHDTTDQEISINYSSYSKVTR